MSENKESRAVLKTTGTVAGGQIINILIGLVRTKVIAIILGPSGIGVIGLLTTATDIIRNISSFGIPFSGVRDISIAEAEKDLVGVSRIVKIFNKWVLISAFLGAFIAVVFCLPLSHYLFSSNSYAFGIAFLSVSIFFTSIVAGWTTVMQGKRAIPMMVKSGIVSNLIGALLTVIIYFVLKNDGIILAMIVASAVNFIVGYIYYTKLNIPQYGNVSLSESWHSVKGMVRIGFFTIIVSVFDQLMSLVLRAFISDKLGVEGVGLFTAANTIATLYLSLILSSMASDFYPKIAAIHKKNREVGISVNNQLLIVLLLSSPIIVGMVAFGDIAMGLFYSSKFEGAVDILKWQILGDFFKIIAWPFGYVFLAKGLGKVYVSLNIGYMILYISIIYFGWNYMGFLGVGISFFIAQFFSLIFTCSYNLFKFNIVISSRNFRIITFVSAILILAFCSHEFFRSYTRIIISGIVLIISLTYSIYNLNSVVDIKKAMSFSKRAK
jgi:antigen flippase